MRKLKNESIFEELIEKASKEYIKDKKSILKKTKSTQSDNKAKKFKK